MANTTKQTMIIFAHKFDAAIVEVEAETAKAFLLRNTESGKTGWIPKSALALRKPGVPTYENEFNVKDWFFNRMNRAQSVMLNVAE